MSPKDSVATMPSLKSDSADVQPVVYQKFGEMELPEDEEDGDYSPSESDSDDSLEWASETERTIAEDELAEGKVGLDFFGAAVAVATEYLASYKPVQLGLGVATILPVSSVQRAARAARRAGMKGSEGSLRRLILNYLSARFLSLNSFSSLSAVVDVTNSILSYMGFELVSTLEDSSKPVSIGQYYCDCLHLHLSSAP